MPLTFVRLPVALIEALPEDRAAWIAHLDHALDVARRVPATTLCVVTDLPPETRSVRLRPTEDQLHEISTLRSAMGWPRARTLAAVLHLALLDRHWPLHSPPYAARWRRRLAS